MPEVARLHCQKLLGAPISATDAAAHCIAAIRECAEETGIWLVIGGDGKRVAGHDAKLLSDELIAGHSFFSIATEHHLEPDVYALFELSWWLTPRFEAKRFDTRFFVARAPLGQEAMQLSPETVKIEWVSPHSMLESNLQQKVRLMPPTIATLEFLQESTQLSEILARIERPLAPIEPELTTDDLGKAILVLPGDAKYSTPQSKALAWRTRFEVLDSTHFR